MRTCRKISIVWGGSLLGLACTRIVQELASLDAAFPESSTLNFL
jgi:hypothetical protein